MAKGIALTIGLNAVDPAKYSGWSGDLAACENDANDMADIAKSRGFDVKNFLTKAATRANVNDTINKAASTLASGDIFMLSYSGHGGQLPDLNSDEDDAQDETWCLYDGELVDDEIYALLGKFAQGVRVLVFSDSCHSGTVTIEVYYQSTMRSLGMTGASQETRYRFMPAEIASRVYRDNRKFYDPILKDAKLKESGDAVKAAVILISGCQDNQYSADGTFNGLFTAKLLNAWNDGKFKKGYRAFKRAIGSLMPPHQTPNYYRVGEINRTFEKQKPFTI